MMAALRQIPSFKVGVNVSVNDLEYADHVALFADDEQSMQRLLDSVDAEAKKLGLNINASKTKVMCVGIPSATIRLNNETLEVVDSLVYLGSVIQNSRVAASDDIAARITKA